jgi:uncharacterized protein YbaR (Trm112 family)
MTISAELLSKLACPRCHGALELHAEPPSLTCARCQVRYDIVDGIPSLLPESGKPLAGGPSPRG